MTLRCKAGDIAVVLHDTPECASKAYDRDKGKNCTYHL